MVNITRAATLIVAASDSSISSREQADYTCDGTDDHVEIQAAINALPISGGKILLLEGTYIKGNAAGITVPSNVEIELSNAAIIKLANSINSTASIFTNSDSINGNSNIIIQGGTIEGNEESQTTGSMYGIIFTKVTNSKIDCWIKGFRSYDVALNNCSGVDLSNRWFGNKWNKTETIYPDMYTISENDSLTITLSTPVDLRNKKITLLSNYYFGEVYVTPTNGTEFIMGTFTGSGLPPIEHGDTTSNFAKMEIAPDFTEENNNNALYKSISSIRFHYWTSGSYQIGNVKIEPLPDEGLITICFDDGGDDIYDDLAPVLAQNGFRGVVCYQSTYGDTLSKLQNLYEYYNWDVISHTYSHPHITTLTDAQAYEEFAKSRAFLETNGMSRASFMIGFPYNEADNAKYVVSLLVYDDIRGLSRNNTGFNMKTPWIPNYIATEGDANSIFRAKRTHSWESKEFHGTDTDTAVSTFCNLLNSAGLKVVTYSEIYASYRRGSWRHSNKYESSGSATITASTTSIEVTHRLASTPMIVTISPTADTGGKRYWVSVKTATTFTISVDSSYTYDISFDWRAGI